ncbi:MAG: prepilin-type N-terminal cleavage/methylation domain-containing protein [Candidatus Brocadiia bacterium]
MTEQIKSNSGLTLAEILVALLVLAIGLGGIVALFPAGQKMAAETEENVIATLIASNYGAVMRWAPCQAPTTKVPPYFLYSDWSGAPQLIDYTYVNGTTTIPGSVSPASDIFYVDPAEFSTTYPSELVEGNNVLDNSVGVTNYQAAPLRMELKPAGSTVVYYTLSLTLVHRTGSTRIYNCFSGRGKDIKYE